MIFLLAKNIKSVQIDPSNMNILSIIIIIKWKKSIFLLHFQKVDSLENILLKSFREKYVE